MTPPRRFTLPHAHSVIWWWCADCGHQWASPTEAKPLTCPLCKSGSFLAFGIPKDQDAPLFKETR